METIDLSKNKALTRDIMPLLLEGRLSPGQGVIRRYLRYLQTQQRQIRSKIDQLVSELYGIAE